MGGASKEPFQRFPNQGSIGNVVAPKLHGLTPEEIAIVEKQ
jgi:hypothetical protein